MTFDEFQTAKEAALVTETKRCFDRYNSPLTGGDDKPACLLEAQFYMQELGRREDSRIARRDLGLEIVVIVLIGLEIVLAVYGTRLAIKQANDQDALMNKQYGSLKSFGWEYANDRANVADLTGNNAINE